MEKKKILFILFITISIAFIQCSFKKTLPANVIQALKLAGKNDDELEKVITYYSIHEQDSLKLRAAYFLIGNMPGKGFYKYELQDSAGRKVDLDLFKFRNADSIAMSKKQYEAKNKTILHFASLGFKEDLKNISAELLIENIDYAFKAWKLPWAKKISFEDFCELILPYRIGSEPLQHWRKEFFENNIWIKDSINDEKGILKACSILNDRLKGNYGYRHGDLDFFPGLLNISEVREFGGGKCEDLNMLAGYCMRSVGIPVALEFTPYWANSNYGGHSWLGLLDFDGKYVPLNAVYDNPVRDSTPFKGARMGKAYRMTFVEQQKALANLCKESSLLPPLFRGKNFIDITAQYFRVSDVTVQLTNSGPKPQFVFLGILNGKDWKPIHWAPIENDSVVFSDMVRETIFLPIYYFDKGYYNGSDYTVAGDAFFLRINGEKLILKPNENKKDKMSFDLSQLTWLIPGRNYNVVYWNGVDWSVGTTKNSLKINPRSLKIREKMLDISGVPNNTMYRVFSDSINSEKALGRPFIFNVDKNRCVDY